MIPASPGAALQLDIFLSSTLGAIDSLTKRGEGWGEEEQRKLVDKVKSLWNETTREVKER